MIRPTVDAVAVATSLSPTDVRRVARAKSGVAPHDDVTQCGVGCLWCGALRWMLANLDQVRVLAGDLDRQQRQEREHSKVVASESWKRDHPEVWDFLSDMENGGFKRAAVQSIESGSVSDKMEETLVGMHRKRQIRTPEIGTTINQRGKLEKVETTTTRRGMPVVRVTVTVEDGWIARVDSEDPVQMATWHGALHGIPLRIEGQVAWRSDRLAIVTGTIEQVRSE